MARTHSRKPQSRTSKDFRSSRSFNRLGQILRGDLTDGRQVTSMWQNSPLSIEPLEERQLLTTTPVWVNDSWVVEVNNVGGAGVDVGDQVGDGAVTGKLFGTNAFDTIPSALVGVDNGGLINVLDGNYTGNISITKDVTIAKAGAGTVNVTSSPFASAGVAIGSGYTVTIDGLTLSGALTGVSITSSSILLKNTIVQNATVFGVQVSGAGANVDIEHSEIYGTATTAAAVGISEGNVDITNSIITTSQRGLLLSGSGTATIHGSSLAGNTVKAVENAANPLTPTIIDASRNWWGNSAEAIVEAQTGGDVDFTPYLTVSTDTDAGATGFAGSFAALRTTTHGKQTGSLGRLQEGVNFVALGGTVTANDGTYAESNTTINQAMTLIGQSQAGVIIAPAAVDGHVDDSFAGPSLQQGLVVTASNVTISTLTIDGNGNGLLGGTNNFRSGIITPDNFVDTTDLTFTNLVVKNIYRRGIQVSWSGTNNEISNNTITQNSGALSSGGGAVAVFGGTVTAASPTRITGNVLTNSAETGIISNYGARLTVRGNQISNTPTGMNLAALDDTSIIGGPLPIDANTIDLTGLASADIGMLVTFSGESPLTPGSVTVQGNQITGSGQDAGIWVFRTGAAPLSILDNTITATGSSSAAPGEGAGVFITDDDELLGESASNNNAVVELRGNTITGYYYGVHVRAVDDEGAAETLDVTVGGPTLADGNDITGVAASGSAGVYIEDNANPSLALVTVENNAATISGFDTGVDVNGGSATIATNLIYDNNTGIRVRNAGNATISSNGIYDNLVGVQFTSAGSGSLAGTTFDGGASDNGTDLLLSLGAGLVNIGAGNAFAADTFFIDNQDTQNLSLVGNSTTFEGLSVANPADNFQIENLIHHRVDTDQPVTTGLVTWVAGTLYITTAGSDHSIQRGIDAATGGNIIHVEAGTYQENVTVNKGVSLRGANYGVAGNGSRSAESLVVTNGNQDRIFNVTASGITIDGFQIDGDDTGVLGGTLSNNSDTNAAHAIRNTGSISGLTVAHNVIKHVGIGVRADGASIGNLITENWFDGIGAYDYGYAVSLRTNFYADVTNNLMTEVHSGLHTNNFSGAIGPATWLFQGNEVHAYAAGVWHNLQYNNATNLTIDDNDISSLTAVNTVPGFANFDGKSIGILIVTQQDNVGVQVTNNEIDGLGYGVVLYNTVSNNPVVLGNTNSITNNGVGVYLTNIVGFNPVSTTILGGAANNPNGTARATLDGLSALNFSGNAVGVLVRGTNGLTPYGVELTLQNGTNIAGGTTGLVLDGAAALLNGNTLSDTAFSGQSVAYVSLTSGAYLSGVINGTGATFGGLTGAGATTGQNYAIEDKLTHAIDDSSVGFVRVHSGHVYVTPNSYVIGAADVQRAVAVALNADVVHVAGGSYTGNVSTAGKSVTLDLGASPAQVTINGDVTLDGDDSLAIEVDGLTPGSQFDQLVVLGAVNLGGAALAVSGTIAASPGESVVIVDNDAADPVGGIFAGLPANSTVTIAGQQFVIYYDGGDGNDVVLTRVPVSPPPSVVFVDDSWAGTFNGADADGPLGGSFGNGSAFGYDQFDNLADAILAVAANGTVYVYNGTYLENVLVNKSLTMEGESSGPSGAIISVSAGGGLEIAADDVTVQSLRILGTVATTGILIGGTVDNTDLSDVVSSGHDAALSIGTAAVVTDLSLDEVSLISSTTGLRVASTGQVDGLVVTASHFDSNDFGWEVYAAVTSNVGDFTNVNVSAATTFDENEVKGIYVEKLDNAIFNGTQVYHSGFGAGTPAGIDLNLKYGAYTNITLQSATVTNSGAGLTGSGITIKGRDDAPSYNVNPASVSGVFLTDVTIDGSPVDLTLGNNVTGVTFSNVDLLGAGLGLLNYSTVGPLNLADTAFAGSLAGYIINSSIYAIDATTGASFDGFVTGTGSVPGDLADYFDIADKIGDAVDVAGLGLVRLKAGHVFVTPDSFVNLGTPPFTTTTASLQRAVDAADAGDTVNIKAGTYSGSIAISKDLNLIGPALGTATIQPGAALGDLVLISGAAFGDDQTVRLENLQFNGQSGLANYGIRVPSTAVFNNLVVRNGSFTGFNFDGIAVFGNSLTGVSVSDVELTDLQFSNNGISGGGGMGDVLFDNYNAGAEFNNLTLTGNRVGASGARLGIQLRGVASLLAMGDVDFDGVDISGTYLTQFIGIQKYSSVPLLSFNDVELGGGSSDITGTFGAALRFDQVGDLSTKGLPGETTVDLGNTTFLGLTSYAGVNWDLEFAPDNTTSWLRADAKDTKWSLGGPAIDASLLSLSQAFDVEDRILHYVEPNHPVHLKPYKGFAELQDGKAFVTDTYSSVIDRAIEVVDVAGTVHVQSGTYTGGVHTSATSVTLSLGASAGQVVLIGDLVLDGNDSLEVEIYGAANATQYDNFDVTGLVTLGGATLTLLPDGGYVPADGDQIVLVNNDGADAVSGTFATLPQNTVVVINGKSFRISYTSANGLGNDVVLVANSSPVANAGGPYSIAEGSSLPLDGSGSFDPDLGDSIVSYEWDLDNDGFFDDATGISPTINWATLAGLGVNDGLDNYFIGLRVTDQLGAQGSNYGTLTITNTAPTLTIAGAGSVNEGALYTLNLSSSDPGADTISQWLISWGDGPAQLVVGNPSSVTHVYADGLNNYVISATATDEDGTFAATPTINVTVNNVAPTLTISGPATVVEGAVYTLLLNRIDPGADTISQWTINWGDGPAQIVVGNPASVTHTYADGPNGYTISATATDEDGTFAATPTIGVTVTNQSPTISLAGSDASVNEGSVFTLNLGTVTDPGTDTVFQYVVFWGDGSSNTYGTAGAKTHTYDDNALVTGPVTVTLVDEDGAHPLAGTWARTVNNVAPTAIPLNGGPVNEGSSGLVLFVGQSDPSVNDTTAGFKYSYDFNNDLDFTDPGELALSNLDSVTVPAQYLADDPSRTVRMRIHDKDGGFTEYFTTITVNNIPPVVNAGPNATAFGGINFTRNVSFTDPGSDSPWTVSVDWGFGFEPSFTSPTHSFNISHTYAPAQIGNTYTVQVKVDDNDGGVHIDTFDVLVVEDTFRVVNFQQNPSGFDVTFNRSPDLADLNLYDGLDVPVDLPDLTLVGSSVGNVLGSFVWNAGTNTLTFVKTGGVLANDSYTVTLLSSAAAFNDDAGDSLLDGDSNFTPGANYSTSFNVASSARTVSIRDFARGPGQDVDDNPATPDDLAVRIDNANGVTSVDFNVVFDPTLLTITSGSATLAPGLPMGWTITANLVSPGLLKVTTSGFTALSGTDEQIVRINTLVPASAPYGNSQAIRLVNVRVNEDAPGFASRGDLAIHKNAFLGDVDADGSYLGFDSALISRVVVALDSGFDAHDWTDPRIVGDATGDGTLSGQDASYVAQKLVELPRPEIPDITVFVLVPGTAGVDPELSIPLGIPGVQGSSVNVPVNINVLPAETAFSSTFDVAYNTAVLDYTGATQGTFWSAGANWNFFANEISPGVVRVVLFNSTASAVGSGTIANLQFNVLANAPLGSSSLGIAPVNPNEGGLTWTDVDGSVVISAPAVFGRHLFYNQSGTAVPLRYDGNNSAINANDDNAIATNKSAYLPGTGPATFANVSSYTKGINGIMIDISGTHPGITAADFIFRVGNNNTPNSWIAAPAPSSISVRAGAGVSGSDRVVITWANGAIAKKWLEVVVLANANTGLAQLPGYPAGQADVFFFGNALADSGTGDTATQATVNTTDELAARNNPAALPSNIPITNLFDYNRDGQVNTTDALAARNNPTNAGNVLRFLNVAAPPAAPEATAAAVSPSDAGTDGDQAVASALAGSAKPSVASAGRATWITNRLQTLELRPQGLNRYFEHFDHTVAPGASQVWEAIAADASELDIDDDLLESLVSHRGAAKLMAR